MGESIILNSPVLLFGVISAVLLLIFAQNTRVGGYILPMISMALNMLLFVVAFLYGATWEEILLFTSIFLMIVIFGYKPEGGKE